MILITSAAYVSPEFQAEIGIVPPCMLPIGNKKIIEIQVGNIRSLFPNEKIILSLPESYKLTIIEASVIENLAIQVETVPDNFTLAESILYVLNTEVDKAFDHVRVLHGDTVIVDLPEGLDSIAVVSPYREYNWHDEVLDSGEAVIWCGFFSFSSRLALIKALATSKGDFVKAIKNYRKDHIMTLKKVTQWYDCGHINNFFNARAKITTQRSFNALSIQGGIVTKSSDNNRKIEAETNWFTTIPSSLKKFTPQFIEMGTLEDNTTLYYKLEYLSILPLNELYVHGRNPLSFWQSIFDLVKEYFESSGKAQDLTTAQIESIRHSSDRLYKEKTEKRLETFSEENAVSLDKIIHYECNILGSISDIAKDCIKKTLSLPYLSTIMHGDLCFSNMLFDTRGQRLKLIDPRGIDEEGNLTILGNQTYDLAKLTHSVIGMYDFIIAGRYQIIENNGHEEIYFDIDNRLQSIQNAFFNTEFIPNLTVMQVMPAVVLLFLSMLPLHSDRPDRQRAMLLNAFRLYNQYIF